MKINLSSIMAALALFTSVGQAQVTSALWGVNGELWNPTNSILRNFTQVGYKGGGTNSIPDWPVGVVVTNFGAIPDDGIDDSQAFIDAIAACPDYHAVLVPKGRYTILQKVEALRDHFVLRGEDMVESVIFFPQYLSEAYIDEIGYIDDGRNPVYDGFFIWSGGVEKSIENLTFEFREERKNGDWDYPGAQAISAGGLSDSWFRNLYIKNADSVITVGGTRISLLNIIMDQFNGRQNVEHKLDAYGGILPRNLSYSLIHNFHVTGRLLQPVDLNGSNTHNVYSIIRTSEMNNRTICYHGTSDHYNLYTDLNRPVVGPMIDGIYEPGSGMNFSDETYWGAYNVGLSDDTWSGSTNRAIFAGYGNDWPLRTNDTFWYEPAAYEEFTPRNLYLAQMKTFGYPLPEDDLAPVPAPYETASDVFRILPTDDITPGNGSDGALKPDAIYLKFDLSAAGETNVAHARLRLTFSGIKNTPFKLTAWTVTDDNWSEDSLTTTNAPAAGSELGSEWIMDTNHSLTVELDVTDFVRTELVGGDGVISLYVNKPEGNGFLSAFYSAENGVHPELIVERVADTVPGAPSAPKGIGTTPLLGNIILDWDDNPESDTATYTVYRTPYSFGRLPIAGGLVTSDHVDTSSITSWRSGMMEYDQVYHYWITAVDEHGYESEKSLEFVAATLHPSNAPPAFAGTVSLSNAIAQETYSESLSGEATDPESDPMYFMKVSGPDWLNVALDGTLSGMPAWSDEGTNAFTLQVTAIGGSTQKVVNIVVDLPADDPPGAPAAPAGLAATADIGSVSLNWDDNAEADLHSYRVYRSTTSSNYSNALVTDLSSSAYVDSDVVNLTTYYYAVTAVDKNGNESSNSSEVSAIPGLDLTPPAAPTGLTATPYAGSVTLSWNGNSEGDLAGYSIYRSTTSGSYGTALAAGLSSSSYIDTNVVNGTTYYYVVTATDTNSNESANSLEISATPDAGIMSISYDFGSGADSIASAGLTAYVENTGEGDMIVTDDPGDGIVGIALYNETNSVGREAQGFYRSFTGLGAGETNDFVISMTFTTPERNWNSPMIGIHLFGDTASGTYWNTGIYASVDAGKNLKIWSNGVENGSILNSGTVSVQVLTASTTTVEVAGTYGTYGADNLQLVLTVSADGVATSSVTATADTTGFSATQDGFGVSANSDDVNRFVVKTFSVFIESAAPTGYDQWASDHGVGAGTNDFDADGVINLYEYGFDGNPTNGLAPTSLPVFSKHGSRVLYVHPQRSDDTTLIYTVETTTNLISGSWTNRGYMVTGTNVTGGTLNFVTNDFDTVDDKKFIRLKIER